MENQFKKKVLSVLKGGVQEIVSTHCNSLPIELKIKKHAQVHSHKHREILFVLEGKSCFTLGGHWYALKPGMVVFIEPWQEHEFYYANDDCNLLHLWVSIHPKHINAMLITLDNAGSLERKHYFASCSGPILQILSEHWSRMYTQKHKDDELNALMLKRAFDLVLSELVYEVAMQYEDQPRKKREDIINFVSDYIEMHNGCDCTLSQLEKLTGYTYYYLSHLFRSYYGKTIGHAINEARMRYFLKQGWHANTKMIADTLGFSSPGTFWKWRRNNRNLELALRKELEEERDAKS